MVQCPGKTAKGKPCKRIVVPGAAMCEHHYTLRAKQEEEERRRAEYDTHCETKCKGDGYEYARCTKKRLSPDIPWCRACHNKIVTAEQMEEHRRQELEKREAETKAYQRQRAEALEKFHAWTTTCEWWEGFEFWLDDKFGDVERQIEDCKRYTPTSW